MAVLYAVARSRPDGRSTYLTPLWPDARAHLVGLLERHAATAIAAAAVDVARRARAAANQVPTVPPASPWSVQLGECCYELASQDLAAAPDPHQAPALTGAGPGRVPAGRRRSGVSANEGKVLERARQLAGDRHSAAAGKEDRG